MKDTIVFNGGGSATLTCSIGCVWNTVIGSAETAHDLPALYRGGGRYLEAGRHAGGGGCPDLPHACKYQDTSGWVLRGQKNISEVFGT